MHQLAGPVGIAGAVAGDKIAITILDIEAKTQGWNHAAPNLGMLSDMVTAGTLNWWMPKGPNPAKPDCWVSELFPDVEIPYNPFPGIVTVLPNMEIVQRVKARLNSTPSPARTSSSVRRCMLYCPQEREITVLEAGGTAQAAGSGTIMGLTGNFPSERQSRSSSRPTSHSAQSSKEQSCVLGLSVERTTGTKTRRLAPWPMQPY